MNYRRKTLIIIGMSINFIVSFVLSLVGTLTSGHFTIRGWVISFLISFFIAVIITKFVNMKVMEEKYLAKHNLKRGELKANIMLPLLSDLLMTPVITIAMVSFSLGMANMGMSRGIKTIEDKRATLTSEVEAAEKELTEVEAQISVKQADLDKKQAALDDYTKQLGDKQAELGPMQAELDEKQKAIEEIQSSGATGPSIGAQLEELGTSVGELAPKVGELNAEIGDLQSKIGPLGGEIGQLKGEIGPLNGRVQALNGEISGKKDGIADQTADIDKLKGEKFTLKKYFIVLLRSMIISLIVAYIVIAIFKPLIQKITFSKMKISTDELRDEEQARAITENALKNATHKNKKGNDKGGMNDQTEGW